jgi:hypothetical protein
MLIWEHQAADRLVKKQINIAGSEASTNGRLAFLLRGRGCQAWPGRAKIEAAPFLRTRRQGKANDIFARIWS